MRVTSLPYFGNIRFYASLVQDDLLIDLHEHYVKQSLRNRCELTGSQGRFHLSVPVHRISGQKQSTGSIQVSYAEQWPHDHREALRSAYGSSPYFIHYFEEIASLWDKEYRYLYELNMAAHDVVCSLLGIESALSFSEGYVECAKEDDLRPFLKKDSLTGPSYIQVFSDRWDFISNLSILDLLFCTGPESLDYLRAQVLENPLS